MRKAKRYYADDDGNMIGYTRHYRGNKTEIPAETFHSKLKITRVGWLNSGFFIELQDENGKIYSMNDIMFRKYLEQNEMYIEGDFNFYQQGTSFSIGL